MHDVFRRIALHISNYCLISYYFEFTSVTSNFPGDSQEIAKLFLNINFIIVLLFDLAL